VWAALKGVSSIGCGEMKPAVVVMCYLFDEFAIFETRLTISRAD